MDDSVITVIYVSGSMNLERMVALLQRSWYPSLLLSKDTFCPNWEFGCQILMWELFTLTPFFGKPCKFILFYFSGIPSWFVCLFPNLIVFYTAYKYCCWHYCPKGSRRFSLCIWHPIWCLSPGTISSLLVLYLIFP